MTDSPHVNTIDAEAPPRPPEEMRLRPKRPPVTRLSRRVLISLSVIATAGVGAALFFALAPQRHTTGEELYSTDNRSTPDGLAALPKDYSALPRSIPKLGPPLPGDLGRPILEAGAPAPAMPGSIESSSDAQRTAQEQEAARTSRLFATTNFRQEAGAAAPALAAVAAAAQTAPQPAATDLVSQDHKLAFVNGAVDRRTTSPESRPASSERLRAAGGLRHPRRADHRPALRSAREVTAQVTEDVYDSSTGKFLLIPKGARLIGQYDAEVAFGQSRALLVWNRLIMPNGRSIVLERQPGTDAEGYSGLEDQVDNHWGQLLEAAVLSTILSIGSEAGANNNDSALVQALRQGSSQGFNQVGQQVVGRSLNIQPTITIRPGFPVRVLVTHDLILEPYA